MNIKKLLSSLLAAAMVLTAAPLNVLAEDNIQQDSLQPGPVGDFATDKVVIEKSAKAFGDDEYEITLKIEGNETIMQKSVDTVLVIDSSGSMSGRNIASVQRAANDFIDQLLPENSKNRVAIVEYATMLSPYITDLLGVQDKKDLKAAVGNIASGGGTNTQVALHYASQLLKDSDAENKVIVVLSDGIPTFTAVPNRFKCTGGSWGQRHTVSEVASWNYTDYAGIGNDYFADSNGRCYYWLPFSKCENGHIHPLKWPCNIYCDTAALGEKVSGISYYTIGYNLHHSGKKYDAAKNFLKDLGNGTIYSAGDDTVSNVLKEIGYKIIKTISNGIVTDPIHTDKTKGIIQLVSQSKPSQGEVQLDGDTFSWIPGELQKDVPATFTYRVKLDVEAPGFSMDQAYSTNGVTTFRYTVPGETDERTLTFKVPEVTGGFGRLSKVGVLVNEQGRYVKEDGTETDDPKEAQKVTAVTEVINPKNDANQWAMGTHKVSIENLAAYGGYTKMDSDTKEATLSAEHPEETVFFKYGKNGGATKQLSYTVKYYTKNGDVLGPDDTVTKDIWVNADSVTVSKSDLGSDLETKFEGYKLDSINPKLPSEIKNGEAITVYYVKDTENQKELSYKVQYFTDGVHLESDDITIKKKVWINDTAVPVVSEDFSTANDKYVGYKFDRTDPANLPTTINAENGVVKVYYVKDDNQTKKLGYTVQYYKDDVHVESDDKSVTESGWVNDTTLPVAPEDRSPAQDRYPGYKFDRTEPAVIPDKIATESVIKVYYEKDDAQTLSYTIQYYKGQEEEPFDTKKMTVPVHTPEVREVSYSNLPAGYKLDENASTTLPFTVTAENKVIKVYYEKDDTQTLPYTIEYYKDQQLLNTVSASVPVHTPWVSEVSYSNLPAGYKLDKNASTRLPFEVTTKENLIKVYYTQDTVLEEGPIEVRHEYYLDQTTREGGVDQQYRDAVPQQAIDTELWRAPAYHGESYSYWKTEIWAAPIETIQSLLNADSKSEQVRSIPNWLAKRTADLADALPAMTEEEIAKAAAQRKDAAEALQAAFDRVIKGILNEKSELDWEDVLEAFENYKSTLKDGTSSSEESESETLLKDALKKLKSIKDKCGIKVSLNAQDSKDLAELSSNLDVSIEELRQELDIEEKETDSDDSEHKKSEEDHKESEEVSEETAENSDESANSDEEMQDAAQDSEDTNGESGETDKQPADVNEGAEDANGESGETNKETPDTDGESAKNPSESEVSDQQKRDFYHALKALKDEVDGYKGDLRSEAQELLGKASLKALYSAEQDILANQYELSLLSPEEYTSPFAPASKEEQPHAELVASGESPIDADPEHPFTGTGFVFDPNYTYTVRIYYSRSTPDVPSSGGGGGDHSGDSDPIIKNPIITIRDPQVPLAQLPTEELVAIVDQDVPLGNLPVTGGLGCNIAGSLGAMALVLGILMKVFGNSQND